MTANNKQNDASNSTSIKNARIIGVLDLDTFDSCIYCHGKVLPLDDLELYKCTKCQMTQLSETIECTTYAGGVVILISAKHTEIRLRPFK